MFWEQGLGGRLLLRFDCLGGEGGVEFLGGLCGYGGSSFGLEGSGMFLLGIVVCCRLTIAIVLNQVHLLANNVGIRFRPY